MGSGGPSLSAVGLALEPERKVMTMKFEQLPRESNKAFAAFRTYLEMGPQRSLVAVGRKLGKSGALLERWSRRFDWRGRVQAHATHYAAIEREATEVLTRSKATQWVKRHEEHRDEEWALRGELIVAGRAALTKFKDRAKGATLGDVARALDLASKLGRLASGMPTDRTEVTGEDGGPIRVELTVALNRVYGEPLAGEVAGPPAIVDVEATPVPPAQLTGKVP